MARPVHEFLNALTERSFMYSFTGSTWRKDSDQQNASDLIPLKYVCVEFKSQEIVERLIENLRILSEQTQTMRSSFGYVIEYDDDGNPIGAVNTKVRDYSALRNYGQKMLYSLLDIVDDIEGMVIGDKSITWNCQHPSDAVELYRYLMSLEKSYD